jgi:3D (Asp-Asp-Asp) domain-containing protein
MLHLFTSKNRFFRSSAAAIAIFGLFLPISLPQYALTPDEGKLRTYFVDWDSSEDGFWLAAEASQDETAGNGPIWEYDGNFFAGLGLVGENALIKTNPPASKKPNRTIKIIVTAYSSTPDQTDSTPFITASNTRTRDGVVANNSLPFGTRVKFPQLFGDKIFVVEDRMAPKNSHKADIWMPTRQMALDFGVKHTEMEIL